MTYSDLPSSSSFVGGTSGGAGGGGCSGGCSGGADLTSVEGCFSGGGFVFAGNSAGISWGGLGGPGSVGLTRSCGGNSGGASFS